jgi:hypothetical protein
MAEQGLRRFRVVVKQPSRWIGRIVTERRRGEQPITNRLATKVAEEFVGGLSDQSGEVEVEVECARWKAVSPRLGAKQSELK